VRVNDLILTEAEPLFDAADIARFDVERDGELDDYFPRRHGRF
jgi:hypothetical protein